MRLHVPLLLALALPGLTCAQDSRPTPQKPAPQENAPQENAPQENGRETARLLAEARAKLQALELYSAWDLARTVLLSDPKHVLARRIHDAARVLTVAIDARVVAQRGASFLISAGHDDRVRVGTVFTLYRGAKAIGIARVTLVNRDSAEVELVEGQGPAIRLGDSVTSDGGGWSWFHDGKQAQLPACGNPALFREAVALAEGRQLYDLYRLTNKAPKDPCLRIYRDAALLAQRAAQGEVTGLGRGVEINLGSKDGLAKGDLVTFLRRDQVLGRGRVFSLEEGAARCRLPRGVKLEKGDVASSDPKHWPAKD